MTFRWVEHVIIEADEAEAAQELCACLGLPYSWETARLAAQELKDGWHDDDVKRWEKYGINLPELAKAVL